MLFRCVPVPCGRSLHISRIYQVPIPNTRASSLEFCIANAHRNVYNNFGQSRSDKIMEGLSQEDVEAFLHVTMVAILADWIFTTIP